MKLLTSIIDIDSIHVKESSFSLEDNHTQIEALANTIIDLGGLVNVPIVEEISLDEYELISGHLEYYAYLRAIQINSSLPDRLAVFISNKKNKKAISKQLEILETIENTQQDITVSAVPKNSELDLQIKNLESSVKHNNQAILTEIKKTKIELLTKIENSLPKPIPPLDAFNRILEPEIAVLVQRKLEFLGASKANKVVSQLQEISKGKNHKPFESFAEITGILREKQKNRIVRLISEEKMIAFIDRWNS